MKEHSNGLQAIDECQMAPPLFSELKEFVRKKKIPGQFLLSGSVRFTSRKAIYESLTGRIINFELLPMSISEIAQKKCPNNLEKIMSNEGLDRVARTLEYENTKTSITKEFKYYFNHGGLPGICFIQNEKLRNLRIKEQLQTLLDRDIRSVYSTNLPYSQILDFTKFIARTQGQNFSYVAAQSATRISPVTQKKLLGALEAVFLIRRLPIEGSQTGFIFYLEDQAEAKFLLDQSISESDEFEHLIYRNLRLQFHYKLGSSFREFHFLTRGGSRVPYAIERENFKIGILPIENETPTRQDSAWAGSFLKHYANSVFCIYTKAKKFFLLIIVRSARLFICLSVCIICIIGALKCLDF